MKQRMNLRTAMLCVMLLLLALVLTSCHTAQDIELPVAVSTSMTGYDEGMTLTTVTELTDAADCVVIAEALEESEYYPGATWRTRMNILRDLSGNVNDVGCPEGSIYVSSPYEGTYQTGETYLLFLRARSVIGRTEMVYISVVPQMEIVLEETAVFSYRGQAMPWRSETELTAAVTQSLTDAGKAALVHSDTMESFEEALAAAYHVWQVEITAVEPVTVDLEQIDCTILSVLRGGHDDSTADRAAYRCALPAICGAEVGERYLLLLQEGRGLVSGRYCLLPADHPLYARMME